jgi:hypothetical protein
MTPKGKGYIYIDIYIDWHTCDRDAQLSTFGLFPEF